MKDQLSVLLDESSPKETSAPDLSVVLVCWNNKDYLEPCLHSLYGSGMRHHFDVVVVDNGSTDGSQEMLRDRFPQVMLVQNSSNVGLGRATNQGIEHSNGRYVLLLNNDTLVNGLSLDRMVDFLESTIDAGAVGGKLLTPDGSYQGAYAEFSTLLQEFLITIRLGELLWAGYPSHGDNNKQKTVDWLSSACLLVRRTAFEKVGLLDEEYFIYGDETDFQFRLRRAGWKVCYLPEVTTIHYGGRSLDRWRRRKMVYRGKMLFYKKNYGVFPELMLRVMLGGLSFAKMLLWSALWLFPWWQTRAKRELRSNLSLLGLCWNLQ